MGQKPNATSTIEATKKRKPNNHHHNNENDTNYTNNTRQKKNNTNISTHVTELYRSHHRTASHRTFSAYLFCVSLCVTTLTVPNPPFPSSFPFLKTHGPGQKSGQKAPTRNHKYRQAPEKATTSTDRAKQPNKSDDWTYGSKFGVCWVMNLKPYRYYTTATPCYSNS